MPLHREVVEPLLQKLVDPGTSRQVWWFTRIRVRLRAQDEAIAIASVLVMIGYDTVDDAVRIANDTPDGLAAHVSGSDLEQVRKVAGRLRAGPVNLNSSAPDLMAPFGGFKQSGNGRDWGDHALGEFLDVKAAIGGAPKQA